MSVGMPTGKRHPKQANQPNDADIAAVAAAIARLDGVYVLPSDIIEWLNFESHSSEQWWKITNKSEEVGDEDEDEDDGGVTRMRESENGSDVLRTQ